MVPPVYPVIVSVYPVLKELSGPKNMLSGQYYSDCTGAFFVSTGLTGAYRNQFHSASYFGHNSLLRTPISMILYSMESLWNSLQDSAEDHLIWPKFEHRCNRWSSDEPVLPEISFYSTSYFSHNSLLRFRWSYTLWKSCEILYKILLKINSFDQSLSTGVTGVTQKLVFSCFRN